VYSPMCQDLNLLLIWLPTLMFSSMPTFTC
jgi:hypothetical protein